VPSNSVNLNTQNSIRYNFSSTNLSLKLNLTMPTTNSSYAFLIQTFTIDGYLIENGTTNQWTRACSSTNCRNCSGTTCIDCYDNTLTIYTIIYNGTCVSKCGSGNFLVGVSCNPCDQNCK
jgi:hypothetical protein